MKKRVSLLALFLLLVMLMLPASVNADDTTLTLRVPETEFRLEIRIRGKGSLSLCEQIVSESKTIVVPADEGFDVSFLPAQSYSLKKAFFNGSEITGQIKSGIFHADGLNSDAVLEVEFSESEKPQTGDTASFSTYLLLLGASAILLFNMRKYFCKGTERRGKKSE